jgi:CRISPR system Cascade subunit CasA
VKHIADVKSLLETSLAALFNKGVRVKKNSPSVAKYSRLFAQPFEAAEDARFFDDLNEEIEAEDPTDQRLQWMRCLAERGEFILKMAFDAGPRSGIQKYRAQSAALSRFHGGLRSDKSPLPDLANFYRQQTIKRQEETSDHP